MPPCLALSTTHPPAPSQYKPALQASVLRCEGDSLVGLPLSEEPDGTVGVGLGDIRGEGEKGGHGR